MNPYIGITGVRHSEEIVVLLAALPLKSKRRLRITHWIPPITLTTDPSPPSLNVSFFSDDRVDHALRLTCPGNLCTAELLCATAHLGHGQIDVIELSTAWPSTRELERFRAASRMPLSLVLEERAIRIAGGTPHGVLELLEPIAPFIDEILVKRVDSKTGRFSSQKCAPLLTAVHHKYPSLPLGVAGNLGPETLHLLEPLLEHFPLLSITAGSDIRAMTHGKESPLDLFRATAYVQRASDLFWWPEMDASTPLSFSRSKSTIFVTFEPDPSLK